MYMYILYFIVEYISRNGVGWGCRGGKGSCRGEKGREGGEGKLREGLG